MIFLPAIADGARVLLPVHEAMIVWEGVERRVHLLAAGERPLIGTALLDGTELIVQFSEAGLVTVEPL